MKVHGKNAELWVNGSKVAYAVSWSVTVQREKVDVSTFADSWKRMAGGLPQATGAFEGLYDASGYNSMLDAATAGGPVSIDLKATSGQTVASGLAWVEATAQASVTDAVRCSGTFQSSGPWSFG